MTDTAAVKIPVYNPIDPALWFAMCESTFELAVPKPITDNKTKFNYCVAHLPPEIASLVRDIILKERSEASYDELKTAIVDRCGESKTQEIRKLLAGEQLGDRKPTELLRDMTRRAENHKISDVLLLELFLQQMPPNVQSIIASVQPIDSQKAANIADRIMEVASTQVNSITQMQPSDNSDTVNSLVQEVRKLRNEVSQLRRSRSSSRNSFQRRNRSPSAPKMMNSKLCWYHRKFKENATKCVSPCCFSQENDSGKA